MRKISPSRSTTIVSREPAEEGKGRSDKLSRAEMARKMAALRVRARELKERKEIERLYGEAVNSYLATLRDLKRHF